MASISEVIDMTLSDDSDNGRSTHNTLRARLPTSHEPDIHKTDSLDDSDRRRRQQRSNLTGKDSPGISKIGRKSATSLAFAPNTSEHRNAPSPLPLNSQQSSQQRGSQSQSLDRYANRKIRGHGSKLRESLTKSSRKPGPGDVVIDLDNDDHTKVVKSPTKKFKMPRSLDSSRSSQLSELHGKPNVRSPAASNSISSQKRQRDDDGVLSSETVTKRPKTGQIDERSPSTNKAHGTKIGLVTSSLNKPANAAEADGNKANAFRKSSSLHAQDGHEPLPRAHSRSSPGKGSSSSQTNSVPAKKISLPSEHRGSLSNAISDSSTRLQKSEGSDVRQESAPSALATKLGSTVGSPTKPTNLIRSDKAGRVRTPIASDVERTARSEDLAPRSGSMEPSSKVKLSRSTETSTTDNEHGSRPTNGSSGIDMPDRSRLATAKQTPAQAVSEEAQVRAVDREPARTKSHQGSCATRPEQTWPGLSPKQQDSSKVLADSARKDVRSEAQDGSPSEVLETSVPPLTNNDCDDPARSHASIATLSPKSKELSSANLNIGSADVQAGAEQGSHPSEVRPFAQPSVSASGLNASSLYATLPLASRVEKILGKYLEELREDNEYWTGVSLRRAREQCSTKPQQALLRDHETKHEEAASFRHLRPLSLTPLTKANAARSDADVWSIQKMTLDNKPHVRVDKTATFTSFATDRSDVPNYAHYVSLRKNVLAPNVTHLHCWPYFGDNFDMADAMNLYEHYDVDVAERERKLLLLAQAQAHESYVESALKELDCSWADVLRFLLEVAPDVGSDLDARKALQNRSLYCASDFSRKSSPSQAILKSLPICTPERLGRVAVLCETFQKMAKFSIWHIARRSGFAENAPTAKHTKAKDIADYQMTCRVCLRFNCPFHGENKDDIDDRNGGSDGESDASRDTVEATDIVHPPNANFRLRVLLTSKSDTVSDPTTHPPVRRKQKESSYWNGYSHKAEDRGPFYACDHPTTSCEDAKCSCYQQSIPCEKSCNCPLGCARKFKGCLCGSTKGNRLVCFENPDCACWQLGRECDPDLCDACGVCDVLDPVNINDDGILRGRCRNASIQRGIPKHTLLGDSGVHGLGLYACEHIRQNEFVGEYKGEIVNNREADRRGAVYEHQKLSYLFSLNKAQEIDSTYFGNKMRFINHAQSGKANLYPRIIAVNTVHRIGLYAERDIPAGKELLFNYGPRFPDEQLQGKTSKKSAMQPDSKKSAPRVRNSNLVRDFHDVEESEDEDGVFRAKAATAHTATGRVKKTRAPARAPVQRSGRITEGTLSASNISDDLAFEDMDLDVQDGAEDDESYATSEADDSDDSEASVESEDSELDKAEDGNGAARRAALSSSRRGI